jgi:hypothetical protein
MTKPTSIYSIIENNLKGLALQTELLEACDWDEALVEEFSSHLQMAFHYITEEGVTFEEGKVLLKEILELNEWSDTHYHIVLKMLDYHAEDIKQFMLTGEAQ